VTRYARPALVVLLVLYLALAMRYAFHTSFVVDGHRIFTLWDDAMISMRYAKNLAQGDGFVWNLGERVQGFTNLGLTLFMALVHLVPVSLERVPLVFQGCAALVLVATVYFTAKLTTRITSNALAGLLAATVVFFFAPLGIWGIQGADSAAIALVLVVAATQASGSLHPRRRAAPGVAVFVTLAVGVLLRLDFTLTYVVFFGFLLWHTPDRRQTLVRGLVPLVSTVLGVLLFGLVYYGDALPNTFYLKATGVRVGAVLDAGWLNLTHVRFGAVHGRFWVALALFAVYAAIGVRRSPIARLLVGVVLLHWAYFVWIGGDWVMVHLSRFLVPVMPLAIALVMNEATTVFRVLLRRRTSLGRRRRSLVVAGAVALHAVVLCLSWNQAESLEEWWSASAVPMYRVENERSYKVARYVVHHSDRSALVAVFWAGVLPYYCDRPMVDLLGRTDRHIARRPAAPDPAYWPGHAKRDWDYILGERKPDIILSESDDIANRLDYLDEYCQPHGEHWISIRRDTTWKWTHKDVYIRCVPKVR
jgi:hypothetical protein